MATDGTPLARKREREKQGKDEEKVKGHVKKL